MKDRFLIIADDVTGSCDSGVQAARRGVASRVIFSRDMSSAHNTGKEGELLIIDTETRIMEGHKAFELITEQFREFDFSSYDTVIKKTDSTLRGNCAKEIRAIDTLYKSSLVFFMPALPALNRTTVNAVQLLNGTPLLKTEFAHDPITPVLQDNIRLLLQEAFEEPVTHIALENLRSDKFTLPQGRIFTCDAQTSADIQKAVSLVRSTKKERILWAGSAGIADSLFQTENSPRPSFAVTASMSAVTAQQVAHAEQNGAVTIPVFADEFAKEPEKNREQLIENYAQRVISLLRRNTDTILASKAACVAIPESARPEKNREPAEQSCRTAELLKAFLAAVARRVLNTQTVSGVFLTGGDTAAGFCETAEITGLRITEEIASGLPQLIAEGGPFDGLKIITKAGGFGNKDAITFALRKLKETQCTIKA